ncbi:MAG: UDP-N-acetylmuramate dehydrogenase [Desulfococcaceae bacterium]
MAAERPTLTDRQGAWLRDRFGAAVRFAVPMARHTSLGVGGPAEAFVRPADEQALGRLLRFARDEGIPWSAVGDGTNLLVADAGVPGIVIGLTRGFAEFSVAADGPEVRVAAGAGLRTRSFCRRAAERGLDDLLRSAGIPGTLGGALAVNAGNQCGALGDRLERLRVVDVDGKTREILRRELTLAYRRAHWPGAESSVIVGAVFRSRVHPDGPVAVLARAEALKAERWEKQPRGVRSAGCFFRNPPSGPPAGALIDRAGLKGAAAGGAHVSRRHANFIVTRPGAAAADVHALADRVRDAVIRRFGVRLEPEVRTLGA